MPITRDDIVTKHATLPGIGRARQMSPYVVVVVPGQSGQSPLVVLVQDAASDHQFLQHGHDAEPRTYTAGDWEALISD